jgi:spermidine synthase
MGLFYGANIAGAVVGCLAAGFYLLRFYDVLTATLIAAALNAAVAAGALALAASGERETLEEAAGISPDQKAEIAPSTQRTVYAVAAVSGLCALAAETLWTRMLGLLFGASVYTLSIILAVFLAGLGIGSAAGALMSRRLARPSIALGGCQLLAAAATAWTAYTLAASLPYWPIDPSIPSDIAFTFQLDLSRAFWALLPPTLAWGASFPLALAAVRSASSDGARLMAGVYAANTSGAIAGATLAGFVLVPWLGSQGGQQVLIGLSAAGGLLLVLMGRRTRPARIALAAVAVFFAALLVRSVPPLPELLVAHGRYAATWVGKGEVIYAAEGLNAAVAVMDFPGGSRTFHVAGKIQASSVPRDMRLQRMLGHLTTLTAAGPRSVLVIGCGAGVTAGAVSIDPRVERVTLVEIEPLVPEAASVYFREHNFGVIGSPKVQVRIDDGRHYLLTANERFDAITADPLDPWVKGAANLYTREFLQAARSRLNPGGVVTVYVQLFETNLEAVQSVLATFFEVFPHGTVWGNTYEGRGYDMVLLGQAEPQRIDLDDMERRLKTAEYATVKESLNAVGMNSAADLFATYAGRGADLKEWLAGAAINSDRNLRMQYLAGLGLNLDDSAAIYRRILEYRRFPEDLFVSAEGRGEALRAALAANER